MGEKLCLITQSGGMRAFSEQEVLSVFDLFAIQTPYQQPLVHWDTPFKIYTPPGEDFGKVYHRGGVNFQMHQPSVLPQREYIFYLQVPNELIYLEFTHLLCEMFVASSTEGSMEFKWCCPF